MKLTFEQGKFVLQKGDQRQTTSDIKAAARFRSVADGKAKMIFEKLMLRDYVIPAGGPTLTADLFPFQVNLGIPHILSKNRSCLAHDPGLGKTAQALGAVSMKEGRTLIVCPSFLKINWAREITKWWPKIPRVAKVLESPKQVDMDWTADFVVTSDAMLLKPWVRDGIKKQDFRFIFIDESQRFKTPSASRTIALFGGKTKIMQSTGLIYKAEHVSALTGTPMLARPIELWPMLYAMAPETIDFMSYEEFGFKFCGPVRNDYGWTFLGSHNEEELKERIRKKFMQVIHRHDVLPELPEKIREIIYVEDDNRYADLKKLDTELLKDLKRRDYEPPATLGDYAKARHANGLAKVTWVKNYVQDLLLHDPRERIILYAYHRDVVQDLARYLAAFKPRVINGGVPPETRVEIEDEFQGGKCRLLIGNIQAMNLGLTLTAATRVVFAEYDWTPSQNEQAEDRANRIGSKWSVYCQYIVFPNSIDEKILESVIKKQETIKKVIG